VRRDPTPCARNRFCAFSDGPEAAALLVFHSANGRGVIRGCYHSFTIRQQFDTVPKRKPVESQVVTTTFSVSLPIAQNLGRADLTTKHAPWRNEPTELSTGIVDNENVKIDSVGVSKISLAVISAMLLER
jgi:hypothetical protein